MQPLREDGLQLVNFNPEPTLVQEFCCRSCWIIWCSLYQPLKDQEHNNLTRNNSYLFRGCKTPWSRWKASTACWPLNPPQGWPPRAAGGAGASLYPPDPLTQGWIPPTKVQDQRIDEQKKSWDKLTYYLASILSGHVYFGCCITVIPKVIFELDLNPSFVHQVFGLAFLLAELLPWGKGFGGVGLLQDHLLSSVIILEVVAEDIRLRKLFNWIRHSLKR